MNRSIALIVLLLLGGCSLFESEDVSQVQLSIQGNSDVLRGVIHVQMNAPGWTKTVTGRDFGFAGRPNYTPPFETPKAGKLRVMVSLIDSGAVHVNSDSVTLNIHSDWLWGVAIVLSDTNPMNGCFGCSGYSVVAVDSVYQRTNQDSLYLVWGGNSIKHSVTY